jgi:hypothetical protein
MREEAKVAFGLLSRDGALNAGAKEELAVRIAEVEQKIGSKQQAVLEPGKSKSTVASRRKELTDLRSARRELLRLQGITQQRAKKTEIRTPEQRAEEAQDAGDRLTLERGINAETIGTQGTLPPRKIGPLIKPVLGGKTFQGGKVRGATGTQAVRQAKADTAQEQAMLELSKIEDLQEKAQARLDEAETNEDTAGIEKYTGFMARLDKAHGLASRALESRMTVLHLRRTGHTALPPT